MAMFFFLTDITVKNKNRILTVVVFNPLHIFDRCHEVLFLTDVVMPLILTNTLFLDSILTSAINHF